MPLQEFLSALAQTGVRHAFENAQAYDAFWSELQENAREGLEAADKARRDSEAEAYREWRD
jgi:hypothetical protein